MALNLYKGPSALKYVAIGSPVALNAAGSGTAVNCSGFEWGTVLALGGSTANTVTVNITRSATSNGTFGNFGASLSLNDASATAKVRSFAINTSAIWHRMEYGITGATSATFAVALILGGARKYPVDQFTTTTAWSDITSG